MFDLYHAQSSRRYFDRKYFNRRMRFLFAKLALCVPPFCHFAAVQCGYIYSRQNSGTHNGRAPSENYMNGNDNIVINKPDQRSALDQDWELTIAKNYRYIFAIVSSQS